MNRFRPKYANIAKTQEVIRIKIRINSDKSQLKMNGMGSI